jgi:hypothetical protein
MADNIDADKLAVLEALLCKERERRLGEEPLEIITGVPDADDNAPKGKAKADTALRVDDFSARRQVSEALSAVNKPMPTSPPPASGFEEPAEPLEEHHIWAQVAAPTDTNPGAIIEGNFTFQDGVVRVYDLDGNLIGTEHLSSPNANAAAVARRVLREKKGPSDFWRTLH